MNVNPPNLLLDEGLDLRKVLTTGSVLHINEEYDENDYTSETSISEKQAIDFIGDPIKSFESINQSLLTVDPHGYVKKKIIESGGGLPLHDGCTVFIAFSGFWENDIKPFDVVPLCKPMEMDLRDHGLLPGIDIAVRSMLVGEMSLFLLAYQVMYGEMGVPPRIKPRAQCAFYIKLVKSIMTPKTGKIKFSEPNMFQRILKEVQMLHNSGLTLSKCNNYHAAVQLFKKEVIMLHKCRLADENEEKIHEKILIKAYINLATCYNKIKLPLKACSACNELNRLNSLWNNGKVLYQNSKALRMIGQFDAAEKRLKRALKLCPDNIELQSEMKLLEMQRNACNQSKLIAEKMVGNSEELRSKFKKEVDNLVHNFKKDDNLCKLVLPVGLSATEIAYIKEVCIRENLFFNKIPCHFVNDAENTTKDAEDKSNSNFALDKEKEQDYSKITTEDNNNACLEL